ncbi:S1C family serine protease [Desulfolucanica intricata]|uniref:S1C family serine protease n=1 Tax=Desulfolucanica intricata TaxID=1285191 RepID=UPI0013520CDC|nr:trypsin-like peptidase domain-containing protein [Desulfolucanica intricata]
MKKTFWVVFVLIIGLIITPVINDARAGEKTISNFAERAKPGVVIVQATFEAKITVPTPMLDETALKSALDRVVDMVLRGEISNNESAIWVTLADEIAASPLVYIKPSGEIDVFESGFTSTGSGFIVTSDGYVVTNAHVVAPDESEIKSRMAAEVLEEQVNHFMSGIVSDSQNIPLEAREYVAKRFQEIIIAYYQQYITVEYLKKSIHTDTGMSVPGAAPDQRGFPTVIIKAGATVPKKDVAILKMEGRKNLPTLIIGDSGQIQVGDKIYVMGYPSAATHHPMLSEKGKVEPTLTSGLISAIKPMDGGWKVFQTDAAMTHGNSGGPVLNEQGEVIGLATFGTVDPLTGEEVAGMNFIVPVDVAKEFLEMANVKPKESRFTVLYNEALELYEKDYYKKAIKKFKEVNKLAPGHPYVQEYISNCTAAIKEGKDKSYRSLLFIGLTIGLAAAGVIAFYIIRRGKVKKISLPDIEKTSPVSDLVNEETKQQVSKKNSDK